MPAHPHAPGSRARPWGGLLGLLVLLSGGAQAQERPFPYELDRRDVVLGALGVVSVGLGTVLQERVSPVEAADIARLDRASINGLDRGATRNWSEGWQDVSDWTRNGLAVSAGLVLFVPPALEGRWSRAATLGIIFAEGVALNIGVTRLTKAAVERKRPYLYNDDLPLEVRAALGEGSGEASLSFFSGHTSLSFAVATLLSTMYGDLHGPTRVSKLVWGTSLGAAALVSVARVGGGMHFPTDVLVGAAVGAAIGRLVPRLHRRDGSPVEVVATPGYVGLRWSF